MIGSISHDQAVRGVKRVVANFNLLTKPYRYDLKLSLSNPAGRPNGACGLAVDLAAKRVDVCLDEDEMLAPFLIAEKLAQELMDRNLIRSCLMPGGWADNQYIQNRVREGIIRIGKSLPWSTDKAMEYGFSDEDFLQVIEGQGREVERQRLTLLLMKDVDFLQDSVQETVSSALLVVEDSILVSKKNTWDVAAIVARLAVFSEQAGCQGLAENCKWRLKDELGNRLAAVLQPGLSRGQAEQLKVALLGAYDCFRDVFSLCFVPEAAN